MAGISPLRMEEVPELDIEIHFIQDRLGFVPNSLLTLARRPDILRAFTQLCGPSSVPVNFDPTLSNSSRILPALRQGVAIARHTLPAPRLEWGYRWRNWRLPGCLKPTAISTRPSAPLSG